MNIITISREFGSGGRELGKRLAETLGYDYYDKEIITAIADREGLDEAYVQKALDNHAWRSIPLTFRHSFYGMSHIPSSPTSLLLAERHVIEGIAKTGKNCIIVGRNADVLLRAYEPFNIFVCANMEAKVNRCIERAEEGEHLSRKEIEQNITRIDRSRRHTREIITDKKWGDRSTYHLTVNTTGWIIKELVPVVANYVESWFNRTK